jgi:hypothetical protein
MITPKPLVQGFLIPQNPSIAYTASSVRAVISQCTATNPSAASHVITIWKVQPGGGVDNSNVVVYQRTIQPGETRVLNEMIGKVVDSGGTIQAVADTGGVVNLMVDGAEIS